MHFNPHSHRILTSRPPHLQAVGSPVLRYNLGFLPEPEFMEAERLNALTALLADLGTREQELRRYL